MLGIATEKTYCDILQYFFSYCNIPRYYHFQILMFLFEKKIKIKQQHTSCFLFYFNFKHLFSVYNALISIYLLYFSKSYLKWFHIADFAFSFFTSFTTTYASLSFVAIFKQNKQGQATLVFNLENIEPEQVFIKKIPRYVLYHSTSGFTG